MALTWNRTVKALVLVFLAVLVTAFLAGVALFNWYVSTDDFNRHLEAMRGRLKDRGINLGAMSVGRLGQIEIADFSVDLGELGTLSVANLSGRIEVLSLLSGKVRTTFDVTELLRQFVSLRFRNRFTVAPETRVEFAFEGDPRSLQDPSALSGDIGISELTFRDAVTSLDVRIPGGRLPIKGPGPVVSFPDLPVRFLDRDFVLKGSIRNVLRNPEFVDTSLQARAQEVRQMAKKVIDSFNEKEISRKVGMEGPADVDIRLDGPCLAPVTKVDFNVPNYKLQFRGEFREIMTTYEWVKGTATWSGDITHPRIDVTLKAGPMVFDYYELRNSHLPHLHFRAKEGAAKLSYFDFRLAFEQLALSAYGGAIAAQYDIRLNRSPVQFDFRVVGNSLDMNALLGDVAHLADFLDGKLTFLFSGHSMTLMLERIVAEGKANVQNLRLVGLPDKDRLLLPTVKAVLPGQSFGSALFDMKLDHASLDVMQLTFKGPGGVLSGFVHYDILTLDTRAAFGFDVAPGLLDAHPKLRREIPEGRLDLTLRGRIIDPYVTYAPAAMLPGGR